MKQKILIWFIVVSAAAVALIGYMWTDIRSPDQHRNITKPIRAFLGSSPTSLDCARSYSYDIQFFQKRINDEKATNQPVMNIDSRLQGQVDVEPLAGAGSERLLKFSWRSNIGAAEVYVLSKKEEDPNIRILLAPGEYRKEMAEAYWLAAAMQPFIVKDGRAWESAQAGLVQTDVERIGPSRWQAEVDTNGIIAQVAGRQAGDLVFSSSGSTYKMGFQRALKAKRTNSQALAKNKINGCETTNAQRLVQSLGLVETTYRQLSNKILAVPQHMSKNHKATLEEKETHIKGLLTTQKRSATNAHIARLTDLAYGDAGLVKTLLSITMERIEDVNPDSEVDAKIMDLIAVISGVQSSDSKKAMSDLIAYLGERNDLPLGYIERTVRTLHLTRGASPHVVRTLERLIQNPMQAKSTRDAAILALGSVIAQTPGDSNADRLFEKFAQHALDSDEDVLVYVSALANTQFPRAKAILETIATSHPDAMVRRHTKSELDSFEPNAL